MLIFIGFSSVGLPNWRIEPFNYSGFFLLLPAASESLPSFFPPIPPHLLLSRVSWQRGQIIQWWPGLNSLFCHVHPVWPWISHLASVLQFHPIPLRQNALSCLPRHSAFEYTKHVRPADSGHHLRGCTIRTVFMVSWFVGQSPLSGGSL